MMIDTYFPGNYWCNLYGCWCDIVHWAIWFEFVLVGLGFEISIWKKGGENERN